MDILDIMVAVDQLPSLCCGDSCDSGAESSPHPNPWKQGMSGDIPVILVHLSILSLEKY